jgi:hypothetical protein
VTTCESSFAAGASLFALLLASDDVLAGVLAAAAAGAGAAGAVLVGVLGVERSGWDEQAEMMMTAHRPIKNLTE